MFGGPRDARTKEQKLEAMASQTSSPREAEIAKRKLAEHRAHPLFRRHDPRDNTRVGTVNPKSYSETDSMSHEDFMAWLRTEQDEMERQGRYGPSHKQRRFSFTAEFPEGFHGSSKK